MRKTMDFTDESVREMVLGAADAEKQISDIAELTGLTEDQIKEIAYSSPAPEPLLRRRYRTYDWGKLDPQILAMIRAGSTVKEIAGKLGISFKSASRRCIALRKEIRSGGPTPLRIRNRGRLSRIRHRNRRKSRRRKLRQRTLRGRDTRRSRL